MKKVYFLLFLIIIFAAYGYGFLNSQYGNNSISNVSKSNVTLFFTGDVMLGRGVDGILANGQNVFENVDPLFQRADAVVVNLEAPFISSSENFKQTVPLKANPTYAHVLKDNKVIVTCLANNHIMDYGNKGLEDTIATLQNNGINYTGAGENLEQATQPVNLDIKGRKIAVLNFMDNITFTEFLPSELSAASANRPGYAPADWNVIKQRIDESKKNSDVTVVVLHYGKRV